MLTWHDCLALSELTEEEIAAIAAHEHCPTMIAMELGRYLIDSPDGQKRIKAMIRDDIREALEAGDIDRVVLLKNVLRHFVQAHAGDA